LVFLFLLFISAPVAASVFYPEIYRLSNGLEIAIVQNKLSPAVVQMVWYKAGSADEKPGHSGLAHYLEHLMFRGTANIAPGDFSKIVAAKGGNDNAFTSYDYTAFHETIAAENLPEVMQMEADRMVGLALTPEIAAPELSVVLNERDERTDNTPQGTFREKVNEALFPNHPYGKPVVGWKNEISAATPDDAQAFYKAHYAPNNAILVVSGNVEAKEVLRLAAGTFGRIPPAPVASPVKIGLPERPKQKQILLKDPRVEQKLFESLWVAPSDGMGEHRQARALEVLQEVLDSGEVGFLYHRLVAQKGVASAVEVSYSPISRGPAVFTIALLPSEGQDSAKLEKILRHELASLSRRGVSSQKVEEAKKRLIRAAIFARDSLSFPAHTLGETLATSQPLSTIEDWPEAIRKVTTDDVNAALRQLLSNPRHLSARLEPDAAESQNVKKSPTKPIENEEVR
jgi:zinc protease